MTMTKTTLPSFAKGLSKEKFETLLDLSTWMQQWNSALMETNHCEPEFQELQEEGEELAKACKEAGFTYEQVETFAFDLAE